MRCLFTLLIIPIMAISSQVHTTNPPPEPLELSARVDDAVRYIVDNIIDQCVQIIMTNLPALKQPIR